MSTAPEREAKADLRDYRRVEAKLRRKGTCDAYPWPHRLGGGNRRHPDAPVQPWRGSAGKHPGTCGRCRSNSSIRKRIIRQYQFHPIRDRERIRRWLPKLHVATSRRMGYPWCYASMGGWIPAMRATEHGAPADITPDNSREFWAVVWDGTSRRRTATASRRLRVRIANGWPKRASRETVIPAPAEHVAACPLQIRPEQRSQKQ